MFYSLIKFLWIAFREYWGVWVTGTGLTGLLLWMLNYLQGITGWKMRPRHYAIVLFCTFWFLATFSAWHDADRNLQSVVEQRSEDTSRLGTCSADLKIANAQSLFFQQQAASAASNFAIQQSTLNSCVVNLGITNKRQPLRITVKEAPLSIEGQSEHMGKTSLSALVIETNHVVTPVHGTLTCNKTFALLGADFAMGAHWSTSTKKEMVGFNKARIEIESPAWNPDVPLVVAVTSAGDLSPCQFTLD